MNAMSFDTLTRHVAQRSLGAAGMAELSAPASSITAEAKKKRSGKKAKQKAARKAKQKCHPQAGECFALLSPGCAGDPGCLAHQELCCAFLESCDLFGWYACLSTA